MRILDLGAHDGFVSAYVADRFTGDLHIDGLELNSHGVDIATRRMSDREIPGRFVRAAAEDAPYLLTPGSYDAVVAFELIEHVRDVDAFLDACEQMVAPNGRIYLSTPDGTFGAGQNPHHLRAYRAIDLAELLRRRGDLQGAMVGPDAVTVASYIPWHAHPDRPPHGLGEVAIVTGPAWKKWSPVHAEQPGGLGGSETAAARLAEQLHLLGYTVTVYGDVDPVGVIGQVAYRPFGAFDPLDDRLAVIASRLPGLVDRPVNAPVRALWMHDTDYGSMLTEQRAAKFTHLLVLSDWQKRHVGELYPFARHKLVQFCNAIVPQYFAGPAPERNPHRVIYTSSPDRGLDLLLEWWPQVREHVPDAELAFCYADVYGAVAEHRPEIAAHHAHVMALAEQPGVVNLGALSQPHVAREMRASGVWAHPSWNTPGDQPFFETFCIGAMEATAAGCLRVMAGRGALRERATVGRGASFTAGPDARPTGRDWIPGLIGAMTAAETVAGDLGAEVDVWGWDVPARRFHELIQARIAAEAA